MPEFQQAAIEDEESVSMRADHLQEDDNPAPANFTDSAFWETRDDERIKTAIRDGGAAVGGSPLMAPWGVLFDDA